MGTIIHRDDNVEVEFDETAHAFVWRRAGEAASTPEAAEVGAPAAPDDDANEGDAS